MKPSAPAAAALLALAPMLASCEREAAPKGGSPPSWSGPRAAAEAEPTGRLDRSHAGKAAPAILFEDPEGEPATLADFRGKPLLLNLWATWCAPCVVEMPTLDALAAREEGKLTVLALSQDLDGQAKVDAFFAERRFAMLEPYIDPKMEMMTQLGLTTLPTTILYDSEGREVWRMSGLEDWEGERTRALIAEAFGKPNPAAAR